MWDPNVSYAKGEVVVYFKKDSKQTSVEQGIREFVFILMSLKDGNTDTPNYDIIDHIPVFTKSNWQLLNPLSYLLQNLNQMREVVLGVFKELLQKHVQQDHGLIGSEDIENNLIKTDYSNLQSPWQVGKYALVNSIKEISEVGLVGKKRKTTNGIMEYSLQYNFDMRANQDENDSKNVRI